MRPDVSGLPLRELMARCAQGAVASGAGRGVAVLVCSSSGKSVEVVHRDGIPLGIGAALSDAHGRELLGWARQTARPHHLRRDALRSHAPALHGVLAEEGMAGVALLPFLGDDSVLGYLVLGLPEGREEKAAGARDPGLGAGEELTVSLRRLRMKGGTELLRLLLEEREREAAQEIDALVIVDSEERILLSQGVSRLFPSWGRGEPTGEILRSLPGGPVLGSVRPTGVGGLTWCHRQMGENGGKKEDGDKDGEPGLELASTGLPSPDGTSRGWRVILIRRQGGTRVGEGGGDALLLELALRVTHWTEKMRSAGEVSPELEARSRELSERALMAAERGFGQEAVDLSETFRKLLARLEPETRDDRIQILPLLASGLPAVRGHRRSLETSLWTLLRRSWMSLLPQGGSLTVRTWEEGGSVWCAVSDDGPGAGAEAGSLEGPSSLDSLLPEEKARGLPDTDLALARRLAAYGGGAFHVESRPGLWNCYSVVFSAEASVPAVQEESPAVNLPPAVGVRRNEEGELGILVVDDNEMVRTVLRKYLERKGFQVREAKDGGKALSILEEERFDRVMVDVNMPGTTGVEFYRRLEAVAPSMRDRTIFMTGGFQEQDTEEFILETGRPHIKKPFDLEEITQMLSSQARRAESS